MNLHHASLLRNVATGIVSISRRAWIIIGLGFLLLAALAIWATISVAGWLLGMTREGINAAPGAARTAIEQVEKAVPGATGVLDNLRSLTQPAAPARDVSGSDPAVARFPGLTRVHWQRDGEQVTIRYQGQAKLPAVIEHYAREFAGQGYRQVLLSATPAEERHEYVKADERIRMTFTQPGNDRVELMVELAGAPR